MRVKATKIDKSFIVTNTKIKETAQNAEQVTIAFKETAEASFVVLKVLYLRHSAFSRRDFFAF